MTAKRYVIRFIRRKASPSIYVVYDNHLKSVISRHLPEQDAQTKINLEVGMALRRGEQEGLERLH